MTEKSRNPLIWVKGFATHLATHIWWHLPIKRERRKHIKDFVFTRLGFLFSSTKMYRCWQEAKLLSGITYNDNGIDYPEHWPKLVEHKKLLKSPVAPVEVNKNPIESIAIIVHAFYGEILKEMLEYLSPHSKISCKLFVTSPQEKVHEISEILKNYPINSEFLVTENRGRDVLPFLKTSRIAIDQGFNLILKLHTKKSDHRMTGSIWRKEIFDSLLPGKAMERIVSYYNSNPNIGILGPAGHIVPMNLYYGANAKGIGYLCRQLGVDTHELENMFFVAGSMFYSRKEALLPLLELNLPDTIFEFEAGQLDGTMAHAYERAFSISNFAAGLKLVDSKFDPRKPNPTITTDHRFTW